MLPNLGNDMNRNSLLSILELRLKSDTMPNPPTSPPGSQSQQQQQHTKMLEELRLLEHQHQEQQRQRAAMAMSAAAGQRLHFSPRPGQQSLAAFSPAATPRVQYPASALLQAQQASQATAASLLTRARQQTSPSMPMSPANDALLFGDMARLQAVLRLQQQQQQQQQQRLPNPAAAAAAAAAALRRTSRTEPPQLGLVPPLVSPRNISTNLAATPQDSFMRVTPFQGRKTTYPMLSPGGALTDNNNNGSPLRKRKEQLELLQQQKWKQLKMTTTTAKSEEQQDTNSRKPKFISPQRKNLVLRPGTGFPLPAESKRRVIKAPRMRSLKRIWNKTTSGTHRREMFFRRLAYSNNVDGRSLIAWQKKEQQR